MAWLKRFFLDLVGAQVDGVRAILALPLLFALLIGWEFAQHVMEYRIGFFESREAARAVANDPSRMALGWIKMLSVYGGGFIVIRHLRRRDEGVSPDPLRTALPRYAPYILYSLLVFALLFYARSFVPAAKVDGFRMVVGLAQAVAEPLLIPWIVSAATDGAIRGPVDSARRMGLLYLWALPLFIIARIPVNGAHQLLNLYAMGRPPALFWTMMIVDAVVVGLIIAVIPALYVRIPRFARERRQPPATAAAGN